MKLEGGVFVLAYVLGGGGEVRREQVDGDGVENREFIGVPWSYSSSNQGHIQ